MEEAPHHADSYHAYADRARRDRKPAPEVRLRATTVPASGIAANGSARSPYPAAERRRPGAAIPFRKQPGGISARVNGRTDSSSRDMSGRFTRSGAQQQCARSNRHVARRILARDLLTSAIEIRSTSIDRRNIVGDVPSLSIPQSDNCDARRHVPETGLATGRDEQRQR